MTLPETSSDPFRAIADFTYDWESWISPTGKLLWVNPAVERLTGYSPSECMEMADYPLPLVYALDRPALKEVLEKASRGHSGNHFEFRVACKQGQVRWAAISWQPITVDGKAVGFRSSVRDIDERKRMEQELQAAVQRAEEANHAKTQFLANITHELRTPLQSIIGYTQLLIAGKLNATMRSYASTVLEQSEHLEHLVSELLDYSALQAGMLSLHNELFNPVEVMGGVMRGMQPLARKKGLTLDADIEVEGQLYGDPRRFSQVLSNLIGNAIRYTHTGGVRLTARVNMSRRMLEIHVDDSGPGLPEGCDVFDPFRQGPRTDGSSGGVGLGLTLSRQLCVRLGGALNGGRSNMGGARLSVELPLTAPGFESASTPVDLERDSFTATPSPVVFPLRILVLDDVRAAREFLVEALRSMGYTPQAAGSADEAFRLIAQEPVDLALVDIQMPEVDGWSAGRGLRARLGSGSYLVALSAQSNANDPVRLRDAGFNAFALKPIKLAGLRALLTQAHQHRNASQHQTDGGALDAGQFDAERWSELASIVTPSGATLLQTMTTRVAGALPDVVTRIDTALDQKNTAELERALHEANGLLALVGAKNAQLVCDRAERAVEAGEVSAECVASAKAACAQVAAHLARLV